MIPEIKITDLGWQVIDNGITFTLTWIEEGKLLVQGRDTCYYLVETMLGLSKVMCNGGESVLIMPIL
jgi:hypothetical protein